MDIWSFDRHGDAICIPTNLMVRRDGLAVMGAGLALECVKKIPSSSATLGKAITNNHEELIVHLGYWGNASVLSFPTKIDWRKSSDLTLIAISAAQLVSIADEYDRIVIPRVGGGLGEFHFESQVKPILDTAFGNNCKFQLLE